MAFRRRKTADRTRSKGSKTKSLKLPPMPSQDGSSFMNPPVVQLPTNPPPNESCQLMSWSGNASQSGFGPQIQLNPEPPTSGTFSNLTVMEFQQYWGTTDANGTYFLPASGTINLNFDFTMWSNNGVPPNGNWSLIATMPGMMFYSLRLTSKAKIIRATGEVEECWFEVKNIVPYLAFTNFVGGDSDYDIDIGPGGGGSSSGVPFGWMQDGTSFLSGFGPYAYKYYFQIQQLPLNKCLWRMYGQTFHPSGQPLGSVNGPYGLDANFGLNMNQSVPITNYFNYGDKIYLEGITASINKWWGFEMCGFSWTGDIDLDGVTEYYGTWVLDQSGNISENISFGGPLQTMIPSSPIMIGFN